MGITDRSIATALNIEGKPPFSGDDKARIDALRKYMTEQRIASPAAAVKMMQTASGQTDAGVNVGATEKVEKLAQTQQDLQQQDLRKALTTGALQAAKQDMAVAQGAQLYHQAKQQFILTGSLEGIPPMIADIVRGVQAQTLQVAPVDFNFDDTGLTLMADVSTVELDVNLLKPTHSPEVLALKAGSDN